MPKKRPTILDVAAAAKVSDATVSRALSGDKSVKAATREKVMAAAKSLGYRPHLSARGLKSGSSGAIGVFCEGGAWMFHNDYFGRLIAGLAEAAEADETRLVFYLPDLLLPEDKDPGHRRARLKGVEALAEGRVDAGIAIGASFRDEGTLALLREEGFPLVLLGPDRKIDGYVQLGSGVASRLALAVKVLTEQGSRRIAMIGQSRESLYSQVAREALEALAKQGKIEFKPEAFLPVATGELQDPKELNALLGRVLELKCQGLIVSEAPQATIIQDLLKERGLKPGKDLSLIAFGQHSPSLRGQPDSVSLIVANLEKEAVRAYDLLKAVQAGKSPESLEMEWFWSPNGNSLTNSRKSL